jgi:virginiamycin B lyase
VDTSVPLPLEIQLESDEIKFSPGDSISSHFIASPQNANQSVDISSIVSTTHDFLGVKLIDSLTPAEVIELTIDAPVTLNIEISASDDALPGTYKILLGVQSDDVTISKFLTVIIE